MTKLSSSLRLKNFNPLNGLIFNLEMLQFEFETEKQQVTTRLFAEHVEND